MKRTYYTSGTSYHRAIGRQYKNSQDNKAILSREAIEIVPTVYAAFALALSRKHGFDADQIAEIIAETHQYYNDAIMYGNDIVNECSDETGIDMMSEVTAKKHNVKGDIVL